MGAGVITDGHLLHAGSSSLVEIGHTGWTPTANAAIAATMVAGNDRQRRQRARTGTGTLEAVNEFFSTRATVNGRRAVSGGDAGDLLAKDIISGVGTHVGRILAIMVNLFNPQKILIGSPLSKAADILFPTIADSIRQQALPAYSQHIVVESTQFTNQGTMAGAALVKDAMYNGSLLIRLLQG